MDREDKKYIDLGILETSEELSEKLITNYKDYTKAEHDDYTLYTFKTEYGEQYVYEYKTLKGIMSEIMDNFINNKDYMSDDMTLYVEYRDGSTYYLGGSFDDDKFKKTGIKNVIIDNGTYAVFGDWIPRIEGGALYIETPFTNKDNEIKEDLNPQEQKQLEEIDILIDDLYKLRQESIQKDGEYGVGNLVFKEMRNMGYLDNLKELKRKLQSKEMSLEKK